MTKSIAVVGAGISGASCAATLREAGKRVQLFDKGRGPGGRMSTRRLDSGHRFDHGTPRFHTRDPRFQEAVEAAVRAGTLRRDADAYVGVGGMNAWAKSLVADIPINASTRVVSIVREAGWKLIDEKGASFGPFDAVVLAVPPANAAEILKGHDASISKSIEAIRMLPQWVAMLAFDQRLVGVENEVPVAGGTMLRSASNTVGDALVVHADQKWSIEHLEVDAQRVASMLSDAARQAVGPAWTTPVSVAAHRWRYAFVDEPAGKPFLDLASGLLLCGDWCLGDSVEAGWLSGRSAADRLVDD